MQEEKTEENPLPPIAKTDRNKFLISKGRLVVTDLKGTLLSATNKDARPFLFSTEKEGLALLSQLNAENDKASYKLEKVSKLYKRGYAPVGEGEIEEVFLYKTLFDDKKFFRDIEEAEEAAENWQSEEQEEILSAWSNYSAKIIELSKALGFSDKEFLELLGFNQERLRACLN